MLLQVSEPLILKLESTREGACYQLDAGEVPTTQTPTTGPP